ncbi:hypothetical protein AK830_g10529 [Neonectria ditissima]|uniref:Class II aldolase/adducin N-terminal domain-containing protein n=1 Tax=Neonectria ditissima TaxID=78410 RepID=A0A0P7B6J9_9HYPO|nr:hypothetical protein AK830_g10529 [Neonectria ditissima]
MPGYGVTGSDRFLRSSSLFSTSQYLPQWAGAAEFIIHGHIHRKYPPVIAACHTHSVNGRAWASFGRRLKMLDQDVCNFYGDAHGVYNECGGLLLSEEEGERRAARAYWKRPHSPKPWSSVVALATAETFNIAVRSGMDQRVLRDVLSSSTAQSCISDKWNPVPGVVLTAPSSNQYTPGFKIQLMAKDLELAME